MPIYEYKCPKCGVVEAMQRITEAPLKKCPNCKSKVERMVSRSSFVLKGSGWYATDYASKSKNDASDSPEKASASNGSTSEAKSESKSDSKPSSESKSSSSDKASAAKSAD